MADNTIIGMFNERVFSLREKPALVSISGDRTTVRTWTQFGKEVRAVARALQAAGVGEGDGVAILSGNRAEYHIADLATLACGGVAVPVYQSNSPEQVKYILQHSEAKAIFVEDADQLAKVTEVRGDLDHLKKVITFSDGEADATYDELVAEGTELDKADPSVYDASCDAVQPEDLACLIYTSGTTGPPKGAMLTHHNVVWTGNSLDQAMSLQEARFISFLPLAHIAERMVSHYGMIKMKGETWFGGGIDTLKDDIAKCRPTVFFAVPRVYEKFEAAMKQKFAEEPGVKGSLLKLANEVGRRHALAAQGQGSERLTDKILHPVLDKVVLSKVREQVGFDKIEAVISGAAPITDETLWFFHGLGLPIAEVYGQTEGCGPTSLNPPTQPAKIKIGTVGPPIPGVDVKIAEDGEILVRGGNIFKGYFKNEEATAETVADGWLYSGDLGELDADGYLRITGRKKDLIITAGGKNISPQNIESALKAHPLISQAVVIGDRRKFLSALITLDPDAVVQFAERESLSATTPHELADDAKVRAEIDEAVQAVNSKLASVEQVKKFTLLADDFTQEAGQITPTLKVRRHRIEEDFSDKIEAMYQ